MTWWPGWMKNRWRRKTPFFEWTIFDEVAHIAFFDHEALLTIEDPIQFKERAKGVIEVLLSGGSLRNHTNPLLGPAARRNYSRYGVISEIA